MQAGRARGPRLGSGGLVFGLRGVNKALAEPSERYKGLRSSLEPTSEGVYGLKCCGAYRLGCIALESGRNA